MHCNDRAWRWIGWDGILLQVPADWHSAAVYTDYLLFEEHYRPVCALKWQQIKGRFETGRILKKLQKSLGRSETELQPWPIPPGWQPHIESFIHQGFRWQGSRGQGTGLLLYSRDSQRALLFQFYDHEAEKGQSTLFEHLLASLHMQQQKKQQLWCVFDICLSLPREAVLMEHEFLPGSFRLRFSLSGSTVTCYRFKPAAELLRKQSLCEFGDKIAGGVPLERSEEPFLAQWQQQAGSRSHLLARLRRKPAYTTARLWQVPEDNVILGLKIQGRKQTTQQTFETLCSGYTTC